MHILCIFVHISSHFRGQDDIWEDIAELVNVLAWDAVGAQIEPYLVQHAEWQRPCGVALGCRSLNSRGIKMLRRAAVFFYTGTLKTGAFFRYA
jgi:hypothetical protein